MARPHTGLCQPHSGSIQVPIYGANYLCVASRAAVGRKVPQLAEA